MCVLVKSRIVDLLTDKEVKRLARASRYGHSLDLRENLSLWPIEIYVRSNIRTPGQLEYRDTPAAEAWEFVTELEPNRGLGETVALLDCKAKISGKDALVMRFLSNRGDDDSVTLEVRID